MMDSRIQHLQSLPEEHRANLVSGILEHAVDGCFRGHEEIISISIECECCNRREAGDVDRHHAWRSALGAWAGWLVSRRDYSETSWGTIKGNEEAWEFLEYAVGYMSADWDREEYDYLTEEMPDEAQEYISSCFEMSLAHQTAREGFDALKEMVEEARALDCEDEG